MALRFPLTAGRRIRAGPLPGRIRIEETGGDRSAAGLRWMSDGATPGPAARRLARRSKSHGRARSLFSERERIGGKHYVRQGRNFAVRRRHSGGARERSAPICALPVPAVMARRTTGFQETRKLKLPRRAASFLRLFWPRPQHGGIDV